MTIGEAVGQHATDEAGPLLGDGRPVSEADFHVGVVLTDLDNCVLVGMLVLRAVRAHHYPSRVEQG